jgi:hypothetical protein
MAKALSSLPNGALIKDAGTTYYGAPIIFRKIDANHAGYPAGAVTLTTDKIISMKGFDAKEAGNANGSRAGSGSNRYRTSNIRQWLNSAGAANSWWTAQNLTDGVADTNNKDAPPTTAGMSGYNGYDTEKGFLANFSAELRAKLMDTDLTVKKNSVTDGGGSETVTDKIFLISATETGVSEFTGEGSAFAYFTDRFARQAKVTAEALATDNANQPSLTTSSSFYWRLRTLYTENASSACYTYHVNQYGDIQEAQAANYGAVGLRPFCNIPSATLVSDAADADGAYTMIFNEPPTTPGSITVPSTILAGAAFTVSWGSASDPEGALSGYRLERSLNGGGWTQIYGGTALSRSDAVAAGNTTVQYRVKAYDAAGLESAYRTSASRTVINNGPPEISGADGDLGVKTGAFAQSYTVTDADGGAVITVTEKIDGTQKRSYTAAAGDEQTFGVTAGEFIKLANGAHTLTITAADQYGAGATRTYAFTRSETQIDVSLYAPLPADAMPERVILSIERRVPSGAALQILVCNNGNDDSPTWEDCSAQVSAGILHRFVNEEKTADNWGVNVRVLVNRNGAEGDCYISSIGGNFD